MSENTIRKKHTGEPGNGGQFGTTQKSEPTAGLLSQSVSPPDEGDQITLPSGAQYVSSQVPDRDAFTPQIEALEDGRFKVVYVSSQPAFDSGDQVLNAAHVLEDIRDAEHIFGQEDLVDNMIDWVATDSDNLLDRVVFLRKEAGGYQAVGHGADMGDYDDFKDFVWDYDAAVVLPRERLDDYPVITYDEYASPIRDFSQIAFDVDDAASGRSYTLHAELVDASGAGQAWFSDDNDGTVMSDEDAADRALNLLDESAESLFV